MRRRLAVLALFLCCACGSSGRNPEPVVHETNGVPGIRGAAVEIVTSRELEEIARLEDARSLGNGRLFEYVRDGEPILRARAVLALGRFSFPTFGAEVTEVLARALEDPDLDVRMAAAFSLGVRADPASAGTLLAYRNAPEPRLRARLVEAASKIPDPSVQAPLLLSLRDGDLAVRMEAALGAARWDTKSAGAAEVDRALLDALRPYRITREAAPKSAVEAELVWRILWSLGRRKAELGRGPFLEYARSEVALERLFAVRGLGLLPPDEPAVRAVLSALAGPTTTRDWRCAYEATVALGRFADTDHARLDQATAKLLTSDAPLDALEAAIENTSPHVRAGAMEALASFGDQRRVLGLLQRGRVDLSISVRAAALRARVRLAGPDDALDEVRRSAKDDDPVLRRAAADVAGTIPDPRMVEILLNLTRDPSLFVSTQAVEQLGHHLSEAVRKELHSFLAHADNGMRLAAVLALQRAPSPTDVTALSLAVGSSEGDVGAEVGFSALQVLAAIDTDEARTVLRRAKADPRPYVQSVARRLLPEAPGLEGAAEEPPVASLDTLPVPGKEYPLYRFNPMVELTTTRGSMSFELFPAEAPIHVYNFLTLVERGAYDRLSFHRVVPDFVVQGGDHRGDGNGAQPYQGEALRAEFTPRKYTRGTLGMPRNEDPDSGGSQFFVTHVPTPHLDGRYTIFGQLRTGGNVLDLLEVGDRILSARVLK